MWVSRHDGSLLIIEKLATIDSSKTNNGYEVRAWDNDNRTILAIYNEEQQAVEAKIAIFCSMRKGDKVMTIPYLLDGGE